MFLVLLTIHFLVSTFSGPGKYYRDGYWHTPKPVKAEDEGDVPEDTPRHLMESSNKSKGKDDGSSNDHFLPDIDPHYRKKIKKMEEEELDSSRHIIEDKNMKPKKK